MKLRKPLDQGDLDGFCGLYAISNCVRLLYPQKQHLMDDLSNELMRILCTSLTRWPSIVWEGTEHADMRTMLGVTETYSGERLFHWEAPFERRRILGWSDFQSRIEARIAGDNAFAIVGLSMPWEHWTVAHRFTKKNIILTDSCQVKEIPLSQCGLSGEYGAKYQFDYKDTFILSRP